MRTVTSAGGHEEAVTVRRSESADARGIDGLIGASALAVFGRVNIIHLLEKANLAVTLANEQDDIVGHASFFDHPIGDVVDQTQWEPFLQKHFSAETCTNDDEEASADGDALFLVTFLRFRPSVAPRVQASHVLKTGFFPGSVQQQIDSDRSPQMSSSSHVAK
ncbi:cilia- and flagella-associated protein 61 [Cebidichthys violaceus]|uniref:cilia- and flagella-associated protein 61 n=1 Tax=Cebidichthys violaceus TaxID=271503 RepID=UPI0035CB9256